MNDMIHSEQVSSSFPSSPNQTFEIKYEGKYIDFKAYSSSCLNRVSPIYIYDKIPEKVFGSIMIKETNTTIYSTFKKKYVRIKRIEPIS